MSANDLERAVYAVILKTDLEARRPHTVIPGDAEFYAPRIAKAILSSEWLAALLAETRAEGAQQHPQPVPPSCDNHREVQHRDHKPPWCNNCGWNHGRPAVPPRLMKEVQPT